MFLHTGGGASPEGNRPFLDLLDVNTKETRRLWQSTPPFLEYPVNLLNDLDDRPIRQAPKSTPTLILAHPKLISTCHASSSPTLGLGVVGSLRLSYPGA